MYLLQETYIMYRLSDWGSRLCDLRRNVADIMFLYDLLNGFIYSPELLSHTGFNVQTHGLRNSNLFHVFLCKNNYSSPEICLWQTLLRIMSIFLLCHVIGIFRQNVYMTLSLNLLV